MNRIVWLCSTLLLTSSPLLHAGAWQQLQSMLKNPSSTAQKSEPADPFAKLREQIKNEKEIRPLFPVLEAIQDNQYRHFMVVRESQLNKPYLFSSTLERGIGERGIYSTMMGDTFLFSFRRDTDKMQFVRRQMEYRADAATPELKAIENSMPDDILGIVPIISSDAALGYFVISADNLFLQDLTRIGSVMESGPDGKSPSLTQGNSSLQKIASFPQNVEIQAELIFEFPNDGPAAIVMRYSLTALPESSTFEPRSADPRVGYFTTDFQDLSRPDIKDQSAPNVHLINRWNLEKKEPPAPVSEVKKPITFWLEDTIPLQYRDAVRAGILAWNAAFEAIGLKNAVAVKEVDKDLTAQQRASFDPADISYNMVRWFIGKDASFAIGPSRANPLTGEILHASISVSDLMSRMSVSETDLADPTSPPTTTALKNLQNKAAAEDPESIRRMAAAGMALIEASGSPLIDKERQRYLQEFLTEVMAHEVGHTLGLRHNFKGSEMLTQENMDKDGLHSASVMDYLPAYIASPGKPRGSYFQQKIGPYDMWAIEYGYRPLSKDPAIGSEELKAVASRADSDARLAYDTDKDADWIDPDTQRLDLGQGALPFAKHQTELARNLWKRLDSQTPLPNEDNVQLKAKFEAGLYAYRLAVHSVLPVIGGVRAHRGSGRQFEPVPGLEQREALEFIEKNVFHSEAFQVSPQLLQRLGNDRFSERNRPFPIAEAILSLQQGVFNHLYAPGTFRRLADQEVFGQDSSRLTPAELMDRVRRSIWSEVGDKNPVSIPLYRRNLQREHVKKLIETMKDSHVGDAQAAAGRDLRRLAEDLSQATAQPAGRDEATLLHLKEMLRQIQQALKPARSDSHER